MSGYGDTYVPDSSAVPGVLVHLLGARASIAHTVQQDEIKCYTFHSDAFEPVQHETEDAIFSIKTKKKSIWGLNSLTIISSALECDAIS